MVCFIVFKTSLSSPLSFHWDHDIYEACPACVRAHELRTCDGKTKVTFEICSRHRDIRDAGTRVESTELFDSVLKDIRTLVHPLYSPVPTFPLATSTSSITATSREDLRKKVKITTAAGHDAVTARGVVTAGEARFTATAAGNGRHTFSGTGDTTPSSSSSRSGEVDLPWPEITYAHGGGCIASPEPEVVLKPKAAVEAMDQYARERLKNITALLDNGVSSSLGPGLDIDIDIDADTTDADAEDTESLLGESTLTSSKCCKDMSSCSSSSMALLLSSDVRAAAAREAQVFLRAEKKRLQACLATSSLAKGLYFKRCNGQWVNAVDDVLVVDEGRGRGRGSQGAGEGEGEGRYVVSGRTGVCSLASDDGVNNHRHRKEEVEEENCRAAVAAGTTKDDQLGSSDTNNPPSHGQVEDEVGAESRPSPPPTRASTPSMTPRDTTATSISPITPGSLKSSSSSSSSHGGAGTLTTTPSSTAGVGLEEVSHRYTSDYDDDDNDDGYGFGYCYGYALLRHDATTHSLMNFPASSSKFIWTGGRAPPPPPPPPPSPDTTETPSFGYLVLQSREQLVRSGQCTEEDLCMTSWVFSRMMTKQAGESA
ncbi:hypothetical protein AYL99_06249 [Fonsecaea erecta]|uniref:Uncharacterized protein n=1 Tax=Fonsecaea erecta TaxID=1367422 RepID=A0A178ZH36_9EURO|nr:hypothetical protein AYL99_06249 [Fonsecaea erecta]OAP58952.1 hypothetical protein AYL99_06249 [Fonsecaea erecta]